MSAICVIGTALPFFDGTARSLSDDSAARSAGAPRTTTSICLSRSRYVVTVSPDTELLRKAATSCDVSPSSRALFWSMSRWTTLVGSSQSNWTWVVPGSRRITAATSPAIARTRPMSSPETRNCTGKPTGGPFSSREMRPRSAGKSSSKIVRSRARTCSRSRLSLAIRTNWAKFDCCSCWSSGR